MGPLDKLVRRSNRLAVLAVCVLPALGVNPRVVGTGPVGSFFYACPGADNAPSVRVRHAIDGSRPRPRPKSSPIDVYERGRKIDRPNELLGSVQVVANDTHQDVRQLTERAVKAARQMGGDAIVDVYVDDAANVQPKAGDRGSLCLTADVLRWK